MRILVLQAAAGKERAALDQRLDDAVVGIALLAVVVDDASAFEAGGIRCVEAAVVDRERDLGVDAARVDLAGMRHPDIEVFAAVARRRMNEARTGIVGDVVAFEQRHGKFIAASETLERMRAGDGSEIGSRNVGETLVLQLRLGKGLLSQLIGEDQLLARARAKIILGSRDFVEAVATREE